MMSFILMYFLAGNVSAFVPAAPQISCEIRMERWCIVQFDGRINLADDGRYRTWTLLERVYMGDRPLYIIEDRKCTGAGGTDLPREIGRQETKDGAGNSVLVVSFLISRREGCKLEFRLPRGTDLQNRAYMDTMLYGILACTRERCGEQLYKYSKRR